MCIFCQIAAKQLPAAILFEDQDFLAFLDISGATYGHTLLITKQHYDNFLALPTELLGAMGEVAQNLALTLMNKLEASGCNILTNINEKAGQSIFHCHLHILPRYLDDDLELKFNQHDYDLAKIKSRFLSTD